MLEKIKSLASGAAYGLWKWAGKKFILVGIGLGLASLKAAHPDWPLPGEDFTKDLFLALVGAHTLTDVTALLKSAGKEVLDGNAVR